MYFELKSIFIERLKQKFIEFDVNFDDFCNLLVNNNAFLSGSFLLQVIQNKFFDEEEYDIDIYTFGDKNIVLEEGISKLIKAAVSKKIEYVEKKRMMNVGRHFTVSDSSSEINIINKYNDINRCVAGISRITSSYVYDNIIAVIDFETTKNIMRKYQLVYCSNETYKTPQNIVDKTDFSFCSNYFDGKDIYIKDYQSILSAHCVLNVNRTRIYNNENRRITKYIKRGYSIELKYNNNIYTILSINNNYNDDKIIMSLPDDLKYLALIYPKNYVLQNDLLKMLPSSLEKLIIYSHCCENIIDNLPSSVQEVKLYIWQSGTGTLSLSENDERIIAMKQFEDERHKITVDTARNNIKKIPFDCKIYINDELIDL